jgi:hypothetical protein
LAVVLLYLGHVFSPLRSPSIKNFKCLFLKFSVPCILVHQTLLQPKEVLHFIQGDYISDSAGWGVSNADIRFADQGAQSRTAYGPKENFEIDVVTEDILTNKKTYTH